MRTPPSPHTGLTGTDPDRRAVETARGPAVDAAEAAGHGHPGTAMSPAPADGVGRGGYVLAEATGGSPAVVLVATGGEIRIALDAREILQDEGIPTRVVSMPCPEWFEEQGREYRDAVLPPGVRARVSVGAGTAIGWYRLLGELGEAVSLERFGASAPYSTLYEQDGLTAQRVAAAARAAAARDGDGDGDDKSDGVGVGDGDGDGRKDRA
ncbi:transketolase-like TK C-terminal-containing protein [Streptomyces sp. I05A-00742]|uniref:transketolase-like TK C-terminal-containing protein n=1 Tax=Streptomyces sp. I05A-00742 TaxID=2732853 RepID=UPI001487B0E6